MTIELLDRASWRSAAIRGGPEVEDAPKWVDDCRQRGYQVTPVALAALNGWRWDTYARLEHHTGRFFSVEGYEVERAVGARRRWCQPLLDQPEIGLLGLLSVVEDGVRRVLLQAKMEPGNANLVQLSPTVQATRSNQLRVHSGRAPAYLEHFVDASPEQFLIDQLQSEQSSRFAAKQNRNVLLHLPHPVEARPGFRWFTLGQIRALLRHDELVNMDTRSVLSCLPLALGVGDDDELDGLSELGAAAVRGARWRPEVRERVIAIERWLSALESAVDRRVRRVPLDGLDGWIADSTSVRPIAGRPFEVIGVDVVAPDREVDRWMQPLLAHHTVGVIGWLVRVGDGQLELLCRAAFAPGCRRLLEISCTVVVDQPDELDADADQPFGSYFIAPSVDRVRYDAVQSEEGGRFFAYRSRYVIVELDRDDDPPLPADHRWLRPIELEELLRVGMVAMEARNLLACLDPFTLGNASGS